MTRRQKVDRRLERIRHRIGRLTRAEKNRDAVTARRKRLYLSLRETLGDDHPDTRDALQRFRASRRLSQKIDASERTLRKRAAQKVRWLKAHPPPVDPDGDGLIEVDGKQVSKAVGVEVLRIRKGGRWAGVVVSGYRTPEHSQELCYAMCGAPSCPGRCAGTSSRHTRKGGRDGAVDVSDYWTFRSECSRLGSWLDNVLPLDPVHFSDLGN